MNNPVINMLKRTNISFLILLLSIIHCYVFAQNREQSFDDDISIHVSLVEESIKIEVESSNPRHQMSFLMQGLTIHIFDSINTDSVKIMFPDAGIVRHKLQRHPNEVRAMIDINGEEMRPDLQPLIAALNEVPVTISHQNNISKSLTNILLNKDDGLVIYSVIIPNFCNHSVRDRISIKLETSQFPQTYSPEFEGRRLSKDDKLPPEGLGQKSNINNDKNRNFIIVKDVIIK